MEQVKEKKLDDVILAISKKLTDMEYVKEKLSSNRASDTCSSLFVSYPALCVLFSELHLQFPQYEFEQYAYKYLELVNDYLGSHQINDISLCDGLSGLGFAAYIMSDGGIAYQSFIKSLNECILDIVEADISAYKQLPVNELFYDTMYGFTGVANYLLNFKEDMEVEEKLRMIMEYLVDICQKGNDGKEKFMIRTDQTQFMRAINDAHVWYVNLGVSHGIPGILLILCKCYEAGISVEGQMEAIKYLSEYISDCCVTVGDDIFWEAQKIIGMENKQVFPSRDAWCYGTPGVAYSLLIAAKILKDSEMSELAVKSMKASLGKLRDALSPTFCHGFSGLCCLARKFYECTHDDFFQEAYIKLCDKILEFYSEENTFGFEDLEVENGEVVRKDEIGLLNGTAGILLTILSCYRPPKTKWDSIFLL